MCQSITMQPPWRGRQEKYMGRTHHHEDTIQRCSMIAGSFSMADMMARNFTTKSPFSILVRVLTYHKLLNSLLMSHNSNPLFFTYPLLTAVNEKKTLSSLSLPQGGGMHECVPVNVYSPHSRVGFSYAGWVMGTDLRFILVSLIRTYIYKLCTTTLLLCSSCHGHSSHPAAAT